MMLQEMSEIRRATSRAMQCLDSLGGEIYTCRRLVDDDDDNDDDDDDDDDDDYCCCYNTSSRRKSSRNVTIMI